jgi:hypothetical protein
MWIERGQGPNTKSRQMRVVIIDQNKIGECSSDVAADSDAPDFLLFFVYVGILE